MGQPLELTCKVQRFLEHSLELGSDFMKHHGFKFQLGNIQLDSRCSPVMKTPKSYEYLYDMEPWGNDLRQYLENKRQLQYQPRSRYANNKPNTKSYPPSRIELNRDKRSICSVVISKPINKDIVIRSNKRPKP